MTREYLPVTLGIGAAGGVLVLTAVPYALTGSTGVSAYYRVGIASPVFVSLLAVVGAITLLSGATDRADPPLAAGIAVTVAAFSFVIALTWALPAREIALGLNLRTGPFLGADATAWFVYHPVLVVLSTLVLVGGSALYTRSVL